MKLIIVTGLSGSGKSIALHTLEDQGFYCIDNLPIRLLQAFADQLIREREEPYQRTAVGIDARNRSSELRLVPALARRLRDQGIDCEILFLDAQHDTLIRRFSETRRKHPLTTPERPLAEAIRLEQQLMEPFQSNADLHIDTTHTNVHELRDILRRRVAERPDDSESVLFQSFGYKHGVPQGCGFRLRRALPAQPSLAGGAAAPHRTRRSGNPVSGTGPAGAADAQRPDRLSGPVDPPLRIRRAPLPHGSGGLHRRPAPLGVHGGTDRWHFQEAGRRVLTRHRELS